MSEEIVNIDTKRLATKIAGVACDLGLKVASCTMDESEVISVEFMYLEAE